MDDNEIEKTFDGKVFKNNNSRQITIPQKTAEINNIDFGDIIYLKVIKVIKIEKKKDKKK